MAGIAKDQRQRFLVAACRHLLSAPSDSWGEGIRCGSLAATEKRSGDLQDRHLEFPGALRATAVSGKLGFGLVEGQRDRLKGFEGRAADRYHLLHQPRNIGSNLLGILRRYLKERNLVRAHFRPGMRVRSVKQDSLSRNATPRL